MTTTSSSPASYIAGRIGLASLFIVSGAMKALSFNDTAGWMAGAGLPLASTLLALTLVLEIGGGLALAFGIATRWVALAFAAFLVPATLLFHQFWAGDPSGDQLNHFLKNLALLGAMFVVSAYERRTDPVR